MTDTSEQVVPGAQVTIWNVDRNTSTSAVTDDNGAYSALFLVPGTYDVQVGLQGFKTWRRAGLVVGIARDVTWSGHHAGAGEREPLRRQHVQSARRLELNALGHQANSNGWLVDGIDNNEFTFNTVIVSPSVEQVREFKVLSGVFSAEFGRGAGVVSVSTKSGTNQLRGTAFEFLRNDAFDARNFFVRKTPACSSS